MLLPILFVTGCQTGIASKMYTTKTSALGMTPMNTFTFGEHTIVVIQGLEDAHEVVLEVLTNGIVATSRSYTMKSGQVEKTSLAHESSPANPFGGRARQETWTLGETVGWHWGFAAAGIGMLIGLSIYVAGQRYLPKEDLVHGSASARAQRPPLSRSERLTTAALILLIPVLAVAIVPNNQIFNAYLVWGNERFDLVFFGKKLPTTWLITLDSITSVAFLAIVALFYRWYGKRRREPDEITKLIIGSVFSMLGMLCLFMAAVSKPAGAKIGLLWPVAFHLMNSIAFAP